MSIDVDPDWWKTLFDEVYLLTDARSVCDPDLTRREVDLLCELLPLEAGRRVLDLCGGQGRHSLELAGRGFGDCTVVDYSQTLLSRGEAAARELGRRVTFMQADARRTGLPADSFDCAMIMGNSLGYLPDPEDDRRILAEARRVLRPGAFLLLDVSDGEAAREQMAPLAWHEIEPDMVVCRRRETVDGCIRAREMVLSKTGGLVRDRTYAIRTFTAGGLTALVEEAGFGDVQARRGMALHRGRGDYGFMSRRMMLTARA